MCSFLPAQQFIQRDGTILQVSPHKNHIYILLCSDLPKLADHCGALPARQRLNELQQLVP